MLIKLACLGFLKKFSQDPSQFGKEPPKTAIPANAQPKVAPEPATSDDHPIDQSTEHPGYTLFKNLNKQATGKNFFPINTKKWSIGTQVKLGAGGTDDKSTKAVYTVVDKHPNGFVLKDKQGKFFKYLHLSGQLEPIH